MKTLKTEVAIQMLTDPVPSLISLSLSLAMQTSTNIRIKLTKQHLDALPSGG